jgi:hypothetical protein
VDTRSGNRATEQPTPLQADLSEMLTAMRRAERELFELIPLTRREPTSIGSWSVKDVRAHMAAWRAIEARRLEAAAGQPATLDGDPAPDDPVDDSNAILHARYADWSWDAIENEADASVDALLAAIERSSTEMLCECDGTFAGIGANGVNHAMGHLPEIAELAGPAGRARFSSFVREIETVLRRGHLMPRDSGVILYNIACARAVSGDLDESRRLLRAAIARRGELLDAAREDPDLAALSEELASLS